ncbi:MAG TPA: competence protein ComA [Desulfosporosinus sp.]|nr:competence protein ComA [Desulfosporosinus sp.]
MKKSSVVFEIMDSEIRAFWFSVPRFPKLGHSSTVVKFDRIPIPTGIIEQGTVRDEGALIGILSTYGSQKPVNNQMGYLAISLQQGFIQAYTLPWLPKRDRKSAISLLVDEEISIARSDLFYDFFVLGEEKNKSLKVLLGATRRSILEQYAFIFKEAGFIISGVDFGLSIVGQALGFEANEDVLYLQEEPKGLQLVLFRGTVPDSVRALSLPPFEDGSEEALREQIELWENEIKRFLFYHRTQYPDLNLRRIVWSGNSVLDKLAQRLSASYQDFTVHRARLKDIPDTWQKGIGENPGFGEVSVGYALRISSHRPGFNLWWQPIKDYKVKQTYLGLAFFAVALFMVGTLLWISLLHMASPLQQEVALLSREGIRLEEQNKLQTDLAKAWNKVSVHPGEIGKRLASVQDLADTKLKIEQVGYKQGILSVRGSANESKIVQDMIRNLRDLGWEDPALSSFRITNQNMVEFALSAKESKISE